MASTPANWKGSPFPLKPESMDERDDLHSILPFLPLSLQTASLSWSSQAMEVLKSLSVGPSYSKVDSGRALSEAISDIRRSLSLRVLPPLAEHGYALYFDDLIPCDEAQKWFQDIVPAMANLLLRFPCLLERHYRNADTFLTYGGTGLRTGLRLLESQHPGVIVLSQEVIAALLSCSFFCLLPTSARCAKNLPTINFYNLFACLYENYEVKQEHKIKCVLNYFERVRLSMPKGFVSFERKVLHLKNNDLGFQYPGVDFWSKSTASLCYFQVFNSGLLEDGVSDALEVDFANKYLGGGALHRGCLQEEIRFMTSPELIVGMLFLPCMKDNEAIEVVGAERFSKYSGYASSFRFSGNHVDTKDVDHIGRRKTRMVAIDALCSPRMKQYEAHFLLREVNKAFCGFSNPSNYHEYRGCEFPSSHRQLPVGNAREENENGVGIRTGNWGCGAFGGDPQVKAVVQWLAASQAFRPFLSYFTFGLEKLEVLDQATQWIFSNQWTIGELWNMLVEYSSQRVRGETELDFFTWLLPPSSDPTAQNVN